MPTTESWQVISRLSAPLRQALKKATKDILVVSPFLGRVGAQLIVTAAKRRGLRMRVLTRLDLEPMMYGATDPEALEEFVEAGARIRAISRLHAKIYAVDGDTAFVGSANLTGGGLRHNVETMIATQDGAMATAICGHAEELWRKAERDEPADRVLRLAQQAKALSRRLTGAPPLGATPPGVGRLDLVYIPKNAKERRDSFRMMLDCKKWRKASDIKRDHVENVRDVLDFGAYLDLLQKRGVRPGEGPGTDYRLTSRGRKICEAVMGRDASAVPKLGRRLVEYAMPNEYVNLRRTPQHMECGVRPWLTMLRLLAQLEETKGYSGLGFTPNELAFIVLSVFHESPREMRSAFAHLLQLDGCPTAHERQERLARWIREMGTTPKKLWNAKAGIPARLSRWPYYLGLVRCETYKRRKQDFFSLLDKDVRIRSVLGLTDDGRELVRDFSGTVYSWPLVGMGATVLE